MNNKTIYYKSLVLWLIFLSSLLISQNYPSIAFEAQQYFIEDSQENSFVTIVIENPYLLECWGIDIHLYADPSVITFLNADWNEEFPLENTPNLTVNNDNDTLKMSFWTNDDEIMYSGPGGKIFDISFEINGSAEDNTMLEFIMFDIGDDYLANAIPSEIILVDGINCNDEEACNYNEGSASNVECEIPIPNFDCNGDCILITDCAGDCNGNAEIDECGECGGNGIENGKCDCDGNILDDCGDCGGDNSCDLLVVVNNVDNNFRSDNIEIPLILNNYAEEENLVGIGFTISFDELLLSYEFSELGSSLQFNEHSEIYEDYDVFIADSSNFLDPLITLQHSLFVNEDSPGILEGQIFYTGDTIITEFNDEFLKLFFSIKDPNRELDGESTPIEVISMEINNFYSPVNIPSFGTLSFRTLSCIDPLADNFICAQPAEYCNELGGIQDEFKILNNDCIFPPFDFENILEGFIDGIVDSTLILYSSNIDSGNPAYTLTIPEGTNVIFPGLDTSLNLISNTSIDTNDLPDVAFGAQLAGPLIGLYPFGTTFNPPIEFIFSFEDLSRGTSEYKVLFMDDIDSADWEEIGECTNAEDNFRFCKIDNLTNSGLFIVMYGENLEIDEFGIPSDFNLYRSYPNPFNPTTTLEFDVANSGIVTFMVYNINGQIVESMAPNFYTPGNYQIKWEARDFPSGIYLIQMRTKSSVHLQKVMLLK